MDQQDNEGTALQVFPDDIWELVVENLDNTEDIRNLLNVFPELQLRLRGLSEGKQFSWLIGDLMPLIMSKYLKRKDILSCRLVSKRWKNSVGTSLETHPDRSPYKSTRPTEMSTQHLNYSPVPDIYTYLRNFIDSGGACGPVSENPFPGRCVYFPVNFPSNPEEDGTLAKDLSVLRAFGQHIWYLDALFSTGNGNISSGLMPLLTSLSFLPNLRCLNLSTNDGPCDLKEPTKRCKMSTDTPLAKFPFRLETLDMSFASYVNEDIYDSLMNTFGSWKGIKKLGICSENWKKKFAHHFPNLTEIYIDTQADSEGPALAVLNDLQSPHLLRKLKIKTNEHLDIFKLLKFLNGSPCKLESLEIEAAEIVDCEWECSNAGLTTIREVKIEVLLRSDDLLGLQFLKALPELQYFTISNAIWSIQRNEFRRADDTTRGDTSTGESVRRFMFQNKTDWDNFEGVWEELPKLKMLTAIKGVIFQYVRECKGKVFKSRTQIVE